MHRKVLLSVALAFCLTAVAQAIPTITVGNYVLLPNTPGQVVDIMISGGDPIPGLDLNLLVDSGVIGPIITAVDVISPGTTFGANNTGQGVLLPPPGREVGVSTTTTSGFVAATGIVAHVTVSTLGLFNGVFLFSASQSPFLGPTDVALDPGNDVILVDGSFTVVPEPSSIVLGLFAVAGLGAVAIRKQRARRIA